MNHQPSSERGALQAKERWSTSARLVINIPDLSIYEDTLKVIGSLSRVLKRCYVLTVSGQALYERYHNFWPNLYLIELPRLRFPRHAARWVDRAVKAGEIEIIHDLLGHLAPVCELLSQTSRPLIMIHTQRTTNWGWFERVMPLHFQIDLRYASQRARSLWFDRRILHAVDHITVMGPGHEKDLERGHGISPERISFIPSETDCHRFYPKEGWDEELDSINSRSTLLYTGALVRAKGLALLFDLFAHLGELRADLTLVLIGRETPFERQWLVQCLENHPFRDRIECAGAIPRDQLLHRYQTASLYLFPSHFEGSPRALREAIASGLPAIASDIPGNRGIDPGHQFIRFAPVSDLSAWIDQSLEALREPPHSRLERIRAGVTHLREAHSPEAVATSWLNLYQAVAEKKELF